MHSAGDRVVRGEGGFGRVTHSVKQGSEKRLSLFLCPLQVLRGHALALPFTRGNCLPAWVGEALVRVRPLGAASTAGRWDFQGPSCSYPLHHCVFVCALCVSLTTSGLASCLCHSFCSLAWHFSQDFINHFLFQLLKFLSPPSLGFGCSQRIRILTG